MIKGIVCIGANRVMGKDGTMPWGDKPLDGAHFRRLTEGHTVVMGRKTFESMGSKPLPKRNTIVISNTMESTEQYNVYANPKILAEVHSLSQAFMKSHDLWIIGGAQVFEAFLPYIEEFYVTTIGEEFEGDTYFPDIHAEYEWQGELLGMDIGTAQDGEVYNLIFRKFTRKS